MLSEYERGKARLLAGMYVTHPEMRCCDRCTSGPVVRELLWEIDRLEEDRGVLRAVLIHHQRLAPGGCSCGWQRWGQSFAGHIMDAWDEACAVADLGSQDAGEADGGQDHGPADE